METAKIIILSKFKGQLISLEENTVQYKVQQKKKLKEFGKNGEEFTKTIS